MSAYLAVALLAALALGVRGQGFGPVSSSTLHQQNPQASNEPPGSLSGRVLNAVTGEPVRGAMVTLLNPSRGGNSPSATTDVAGTFSAGNLPPGDYYIQAGHPNYLGLLGLPSPGQTVTVASAKDSSGVTLRLMPGGVISGKVLDDGGEPVPGCPVSAIGPGQGMGSAAMSVKGVATANDKGEYKFEALTADRYIVFARCQESLPVERPLAVWRPELIEPAESWLPVFYPGSPSPEGAQWLTLMPGGELTGIDFRLQVTPVTTVSGTLSGVTTGAANAQIQLSPVNSPLDQSLDFGAAFDPATSTFKFQMVPPGSYRLAVVTNPWLVQSLAFASVNVIVGRSRPAPLFLQMHPGLTVSGVVEQPPSSRGGGNGNVVMVNSLQDPGRQTPKAPPLGSLNFIPLAQVPFPNMRQVEVRQDGTFTALGLTPGRYKVIPQIWAAQPASVESIQFGAAQASHGVIDLTEGASGALRVRMGGNPAQVSVSLADAPAGSRGDSGGQWLVLALPADEPVGPFGPLTSLSGKSGDTVRMQNLNPGKFAFVALEMAMGGMQSERLNQLLREHVEPVEIVAGQEQTVTPKYFTGQEIEKLALAYLRGETR